MVAAIIALITALISYFGAKKSGASDTAALAVGAAAGAGTYYVATQTDWGKGIVSSIDTKWAQLTGSDGKPLTTADGQPIIGPEGSTPVKNPDGSYAKDDKGNIVFELGGKLISSAGEVLKSWGPVGTAGVIGVGAGLASGIPPWVLLAGGGVLLFALLK